MAESACPEAGNLDMLAPARLVCEADADGERNSRADRRGIWFAAACQSGPDAPDVNCRMPASVPVACRKAHREIGAK